VVAGACYAPGHDCHCTLPAGTGRRLPPTFHYVSACILRAISTPQLAASDLCTVQNRACKHTKRRSAVDLQERLPAPRPIAQKRKLLQAQLEHPYKVPEPCAPAVCNAATPAGIWVMPETLDPERARRLLLLFATDCMHICARYHANSLHRHAVYTLYCLQ
jgi:hypothetical protein